VQTMVKGWQSRVEKVENRRNEAKQRKQNSVEKRNFKAMVQELLALLDRHGDAIRQRADRSLLIHVWTDCPPSDSPPILDLVDEKEGKAGKRRGRSNSTNEPPSSGKKKTHPRSKEATPEPQAEEELAPSLCRQHFFTGTCEGMRSGKKGGCRNFHFPKRLKTLAGVLGAKGNGASAKDNLAMADTAFRSYQQDESDTNDADVMEMIHYFSVEVPSGSATDEPMPLNNLVAEALSSRSCSMASVVYFAINDILLFDRYRDGLLVPEKDFLITATGSDGTRPRGQSIVSEEEAEKAMFLPGPVLEYILTFLPDTAVASTRSVCRAWNEEIGKVSGFLWRHLLERRNWPDPEALLSSTTTNEGNAEEAYRMQFRDAFLSHYSATRDCKALQTAMAGLTTKKSVQEKEACFRSFNNLRGAPQEPNCCVGLAVWSPNHFLAAYSHDCSLRLFTAVPRAGNSGEKLCKELVSQKLDPYKNTKKRTSRLVAMGLDEELIGCLCHVMADKNDEGEAFILTVLNREDFLLADEGDEDALQVIDIGQSVLNYLLSCEENDHGLLLLRDFLSEGEELEDVEVLVSRSMTACGYGRFMVEVAVSIPRMEVDDDEDSATNMNLLFRKLFLFSASLGAIVWMGDSHSLTQPMCPRHEDMTLTSIRTRTAAGSRIGCNFAVLSSTSSEIMSGSIDPAGHIASPKLVEGSALVRNEIIEVGWELRARQQRPVVITPTEIIVSDTFIRELENGERFFKSIISFYPLFVGDDTPIYSTLQLDGKVEVDSLVRVRDHHVMALCRHYYSISDATEVDDLRDDRFGYTEEARVSVLVVIVDLRSKTEIARMSLVDDLGSQLNTDPLSLRGLPLKAAIDGDTVVAGMWWRGAIMTGQDVRSVSETSKQTADRLSPTKSSKKKIKKPLKRGGKMVRGQPK
jgi:hypothetical protein